MEEETGKFGHYMKEEIESGWQEYLAKSPEERGFKDPLSYSDKDLHLNQVCQVIPDPLKEKAKYAPSSLIELPRVCGNYNLALRLFLASERPRYPDLTNSL